MVVHNVGEVIGRKFVGAFPEHFVVQGVCIHFHVAADKVVHLHNAVQGHFEADGPVRGGFQEAFYLLLRQRERVTQASPAGGVVHERFLGGLCSGAAGVQFLCRVKGVIGPAGSDELLCILPINGPALALAVRSVRMLGGGGFYHLAVLIYTLVRDNAAPVKCFNDILFRPGHKAVGIRILNADDEITALLLGIKVIVQCRTYTAHVQRAGG